MNIEIRSYINPQYGEQHPVRMQFQWDTDVVPLAGPKRRTQRNQLLEQPIRHFFINYDALTEPGRDRFLEIFNRGKGQYNTFLFLDREDFLCDREQIATDGSSAAYQLCKTYYPNEAEKWTEDKKDIVPGDIFAPVVTHDPDGPQTEVESSPGADEFTLDDTTGIMTWSGGNEPSAGVLTVTFQFYFRVRFTFDTHTDVRFAERYWRAQGIHLVEDE